MKPRGLITVFRKIGLPLSIKTLDNYQKRGVISLRRLPSGHRIVTEADLEGIIKAFSPGGSGKWIYEESN